MDTIQKEEIKKVLEDLKDGIYYLFRYDYNLPSELQERIITLHRVSIQKESPFVLGCSNPSDDGTYNELSVYEIIPDTSRTHFTIPIIEGVKMELFTLTKGELIETLLPLIDGDRNPIINYNNELF